MKDFALSILLMNTDLELAPEDFIIPDDFDSVQGTDLPRIFHITISKLETFTCCPFIRQMAFEWTKTGRHIQMHRTKGMQDISFGVLGRGLCPHFFRTALRVISRLSFARPLDTIWRIPMELTEQHFLALPIHPTLAFLRTFFIVEWLSVSTEFKKW